MGWKTNPEKLQTCPICGGKAHHFSVLEEIPRSGWCWTPPSTPPPGWHATENPNLFLQDGSGFPHTPPAPPAQTRHELADPRLRDVIYRRILERLPLSGTHRSEILQRGFHKEDIEKIPFGSLLSGPRTGLVERIAFDIPARELEGIPGLYLDKYGHWTLTGSPGLLIPVQDEKSRIIALQVRPDEAKEGGRYRWVSSNGKPGGTGSGAPAGVVLPEKAATMGGRVWLTEGFFKALALSQKTGEAVVWIAGVGMVQAALEPLSRLDPSEVLLAFDADWKTKDSVHIALFNAVGIIGTALGVPTQAVTWEIEKGKGIDDALLSGGLNLAEMTLLGLDDIVAGLAPPARLPNTRFLRINPNNTNPSTPPPQEANPPTQEEIRFATEQTVVEAYQAPLGTITLITAGTGSGKSFSACHQAPEKTLFVDRDYDTAGEQKRRMLLEFGHAPEMIYGRQPPEGDLPPEATEQRRERSRLASCVDYTRANLAGESGHNACKDCKNCPVEVNGETFFACGYRKQRDKLHNDPPSIGLCVPETALDPSVLQHFNTLVFDDIPDLLYRLADKKTVMVEDIALWQTNNPEQMPQGFSSFLQSLRNEQATATDKADPSEALRESAKNAIASLDGMDGTILPCEEPITSNGLPAYPKRLVLPLLTALSTNAPVEIRPESVTFWTCQPEILRTLRNKRVLVLDATPDAVLWKALFGQAQGFTLHMPNLPTSNPRIVQTPDIIGTSEQIVRLAAPIKALAAREEAFVLTRKGKCAEALNADGWMGRHDRGLNELQGYKNGILAGNFTLPPDETGRMANGTRALAGVLGVPPPQVEIPLAEEPSRTWHPYQDSGRFAGLERNAPIHTDPLADHIGRRHHTSSVVQAWGRLRSNGTLYLLAGTPLEGVPVTIMTLQELGLSIDEKRGNPKLEVINKERVALAKDRARDGVAVLVSWMEERQREPSLREAKRLLAGKGRGESPTRLAKDALILAKKTIFDKKQQLAGMVEGVSHNSVNIYTTLCDTPPPHSANHLETNETIIFETSNPEQAINEIRGYTLDHSANHPETNETSLFEANPTPVPPKEALCGTPPPIPLSTQKERESVDFQLKASPEPTMLVATSTRQGTDSICAKLQNSNIDSFSQEICQKTDAVRCADNGSIGLKEGQDTCRKNKQPDQDEDQRPFQTSRWRFD